MLRISVAVVSASLLASTAFAQVERTPYQIKVSALGVDFHDAASTKDFYGRLRMAANVACDSGAPKDLAVTLDDHRCARQALVAAVHSINEPMLSQAAGLPSTTALASNTR